MTVKSKVVNYLAKRKTAASSKEIAMRVEANWKTVRNVLGILMNEGAVSEASIKCKVDNAPRNGYVLAR